MALRKRVSGGSLDTHTDHTISSKVFKCSETTVFKANDVNLRTWGDELVKHVVKHVADVLPPILVSRYGVPGLVVRHSRMNSCLTSKSAPTSDRHRLRAAAMPDELSGVGENDAWTFLTARRCHAALDGFDEVDGRADIDTALSCQAIRKNAQVLTRFPEEDDDSASLEKAFGHQYRDMLVNSGGSKRKADFFEAELQES